MVDGLRRSEIQRMFFARGRDVHLHGGGTGSEATGIAVAPRQQNESGEQTRRLNQVLVHSEIALRSRSQAELRQGRARSD